MTYTDDVDHISVVKPIEHAVQHQKHFVPSVSLHQYGNEAVDTSYHANCNHSVKAQDIKRNPEVSVFRFFDLPAEVRNQIYRELLLTRNAISRAPNPKFFIFYRPESPLYVDEDPEVGEGQDEYLPEVGTVVSENIHVEKSTCSMALLRVNRQMYREASHIFSENIWVRVHMNKAGLGRDLKSRGYNVQAEGWRYRHNVKRALDIHIRNPTGNNQGADSFLISLAAIAQLPRALFTLVGFTSLEFTIPVRPQFQGKFGPESEIVTAFRQLQVTKPVKISEDDFVFEELAFAMHVVQLDHLDDPLWLPPPTIQNWIWSRLRDSILVAQLQWELDGSSGRMRALNGIC